MSVISQYKWEKSGTSLRVGSETWSNQEGVINIHSDIHGCFGLIKHKAQDLG